MIVMSVSEAVVFVVYIDHFLFVVCHMTITMIYRVVITCLDDVFIVPYTH